MALLLLLTVYGAMKAGEKRAQNINKTSPVLHMHSTPEEDPLLHSCVRALCVCRCRVSVKAVVWVPDKEEAATDTLPSQSCRRQFAA